MVLQNALFWLAPDRPSSADRLTVCSAAFIVADAACNLALAAEIPVNMPPPCALPAATGELLTAGKRGQCFCAWKFSFIS